MKNSADLGGCYPPRPSASVDNTLLYLQNSSYPTQPHLIIANYYSFKIFPRFWLVKTTRIIHHNQLLFTKFGKNLRHIASVTSKVEPSENYWTIDVKSAARYRLLNRWPKKTGDEIVLQQDGWKHKNKHGGQPHGCNRQQKIRHWKSRGFWSKQTWPKWGAWIAYKFSRGIYFERLERSNSQPKHKAV